MSVTTTTASPILKTLYPQKRVQNLVYKDHPLFAMLKKDTNFVGKNRVCAVRYRDTQGRSSVFATAQSGAQGTYGNFAAVDFVITRVKDYQVVTLETEAILAAKNDEGALIKTLDTEMASGLNNIAKSLAMGVYGDGGGSIGRVTGTTSPFTLVSVNDISNIEVGMTLAVSDTANGTLRNSGAVMTVLTVNRDSGTFTASGIPGAIAANDYLFPAGDGANGSTNVRMSGLAAWIPATAPTSTAFFGIDRSIDSSRLGGLRVDVSSESPEEGLLTVAARVSRDGGRISHVFMNPVKWAAYAKALGTKVEYETMQVGEIGFDAIKFMGPKGPVGLVADQDCPFPTAYGLSLDTWTLASLNDAPFIQDMDGNRLSREASADRYEARISFFGNLECSAPGWNVNITLP
jgi:hypothetical protein